MRNQKWTYLTVIRCIWPKKMKLIQFDSNLKTIKLWQYIQCNLTFMKNVPIHKCDLHISNSMSILFTRKIYERIDKCIYSCKKYLIHVYKELKKISKLFIQYVLNQPLEFLFFSWRIEIGRECRNADCLGRGEWDITPRFLCTLRIKKKS